MDEYLHDVRIKKTDTHVLLVNKVKVKVAGNSTQLMCTITLKIFSVYRTIEVMLRETGYGP